MNDRKLSDQLTRLTKPERPIFAVIGPTASGKTSRALALADNLLADYQGVNLISVDSRQVYRGLEILTGADVPKKFKQVDNFSLLPHPFYQHQKKSIRLHGISIVDLKKDWSVSHFLDFASYIIDWSVKHKRAVILVGGTGLYHRQLRLLLEGKEMIDVPPNPEIREKAEKMSVRQLQNWLKEVDKEKLARMNQSDKNNPRRLIRAIEIASTPLPSRISLKTQWQRKFDYQMISVFPDNLDQLKVKIRKRVIGRLNNGVVEEVKHLLRLDLSPTSQVMTTLGVPEMRQFLIGKLTKAELIDLWALHEFQYAKRQLVWWRKHL